MHVFLIAWLALCRLANSVTHDIHKLPFRGTISNGEVKVEQTKMGHSPPIWFVFSGAALYCCARPGPPAWRPVLWACSCQRWRGPVREWAGEQTCSRPMMSMPMPIDVPLVTQHVGAISCAQALLHCREAGTPQEQAMKTHLPE